jgi:hypothetical protein
MYIYIYVYVYIYMYTYIYHIVEEMIVTMKMATPTEGLMTLSETANPRLFSMAKVGLGALGVVTELTMKCIPCLELLEVCMHLYICI